MALERMIQISFIFDANCQHHLDIIVALAKVQIFLVDCRTVRRNKNLDHIIDNLVT